MTPLPSKNDGFRPAILLVSQEHFLLQEREEQIRDRLIPPESRDLNFISLYSWEAGITQVVEFLQTMPFLSDRRLLVLREIQDFEGIDQLLAYLKDPNPTSCLLMTSSELKRKDSLFKKISSLAEATELKKPAGGRMVDWVVQRCSQREKQIDRELADALIQITGGDMSILQTELEKVVSSAGERDRISPEDLSVSVPGGIEVVFNFLDALGDGDRPRAVAAGKRLLDDGNRPEYLVHMIAWHFRQLIRGRDLVDSGLSPSQAAEKMGKNYPEARNKFARQIGRATGEGLIQAMCVLSDYDLQLKRGGVPERIVLDRLVLDLLRGEGRVDLF